MVLNASKQHLQTYQRLGILLAKIDGIHELTINVLAIHQNSSSVGNNSQAANDLPRRFQCGQVWNPCVLPSDLVRFLPFPAAVSG